MADRNITSFPIPANYINAAKVPYDNTASGLTATNTQAAVDETVSSVNALSSSMAKSILTATKNVNANSTDTLRDLNVIPDERAFYFVALQADTGTSDCAAAYIFWYNKSSAAYNVSAIFEGSGARAPRITSAGVLKLNSLTSNVTIKMVFVRMSN